MAQLAIKGHATRGKEVIQLLEMLGSKNIYKLDGKKDLWYILSNSTIEHATYRFEERGFTLEEFEEKFPYKVGDKVTNEYRLPMIIFDMYWDSDFNVIKYNVRFLDDDKTVRTGLTAEDLQPYKEEETMEEPKELIIGFTKDDNGDWVLNTHKDYEIKEIEGKFKVIKKQPQYPKDYEECCDVLGILEDRGFGFINLSECENTLMSHFIQLKRCRNAYWKIAGEQMGLGKPWEPDWNDCTQHKFGLYTLENEIRCINLQVLKNIILAFPTAEMRDAFYENFKELIEQCKELL